MDKALASLAGKIARSKKVVAFTGSGISAESGIPTFRGEGGVWETYNPGLYANIPGLLGMFFLKPSKVHAFSRDVLSTFVEAEPNPAHKALARLEELGHLRAVITQNIDDLHERAGNRKVIKLHGDLFRLRCLRCKARSPLLHEELVLAIKTLEGVRPTRRHLFRAFRRLLPPCPHCGGTTRPDVVFFGESLPRDDLAEAYAASENCEIMLVVGTSGVVYPAASLPQLAARKGALLAEFSMEPTEMTGICHMHFQGEAGNIMNTLTGYLERI